MSRTTSNHLRAGAVLFERLLLDSKGAVLKDYLLKYDLHIVDVEHRADLILFPPGRVQLVLDSPNVGAEKITGVLSTDDDSFCDAVVNHKELLNHLFVDDADIIEIIIRKKEKS